MSIPGRTSSNTTTVGAMPLSVAMTVNILVGTPTLILCRVSHVANTADGQILNYPA